MLRVLANFADRHIMKGDERIILIHMLHALPFLQPHYASPPGTHIWSTFTKSKISRHLEPFDQFLVLVELHKASLKACVCAEQAF